MSIKFVLERLVQALLTMVLLSLIVFGLVVAIGVIVFGVYKCVGNHKLEHTRTVEEGTTMMVMRT